MPTLTTPAPTQEQAPEPDVSTLTTEAEPALEPLSEPGPEGEAPEEQEQTAASDELPKGWQENPRVKEALDARYREAQSHAARAQETAIDRAVLEARQQTVTDLDEVHARDLTYARELAAADTVVMGLRDSIVSAVQGGDPEERQQLARILAQNKPWADAYNAAQHRAGMEDAFDAMVTAPAFSAGLDVDGRRQLAQKVQGIILDYRLKKLEPADLMAVGQAARDAVRDPGAKKQWAVEEQKRLEDLAKKQAGAVDRANGRTARGEAVAPTGGAGGGGSSHYRTKAEARKLHADGKISDNEMRQVKRSSLPDR